MRYRILSRAALFRFLLHLLPAEAAIPFLVSRCIHDPLIYASEAAMLEQGFLRWEGCGMGVPGGRNLIRASVDCPAAVAYNTRQPMSFLVMMNALPVMGTLRRFCWLGFCGNRYGWGWFRGRRFCWCRLHRLWWFRRLRWVGGFRFRLCGLCRLGRLGGKLCRLSRRRLHSRFRYSRRCGFLGRLGLNRLRWKRRSSFLFLVFLPAFLLWGNLLSWIQSRLHAVLEEGAALLCLKVPEAVRHPVWVWSWHIRQHLQ